MTNNLDYNLEITKRVQLELSDLDIISGQIKNLMYEADTRLTIEQEATEETIDSMERKYWEGVRDVLVNIYIFIDELYYVRNGGDNV